MYDTRAILGQERNVTALEEIAQDELAVGVARALAIANHTAASHGTNLQHSLVTITEDAPPPHRRWRVHYGPRDYVGRRGGDLIVIVDETTGQTDRILRGQ